MQSKSVLIVLTLLLFISATGKGETANTTLHKQYYDSMTGTVMCGYQGWFACPDDGSELDRWHHWGKSGEIFKPGACTIDLWPDTSEYDEEELYDTDFRNADGTVAQVFSSYNESTVMTHFRWMREYGIDGGFVQRFITETTPGSNMLKFRDRVTLNCRLAANKNMRAWAVMYDLSGLGSEQADRVKNDWKHLVDDYEISQSAMDRSYLHHNGKPVVAIWGIGFNDNRKYSLQDCADMIDFFKNDPKYGNCTVMIGIPSYWREGRADCVSDPYRIEVFKKADILSPWAVGRYNSKDINSLNRYVDNVWKKDIIWCKENGLEYLPVIFPGFSWYNMHDKKSPLNQIPRDKGNFLWQQAYQAKQAGATMLYQAMFDEVDEGTAIFKCTNTPPNGESQFIDYEGLPSDFYLKLVGNIGKMLRGEIANSEIIPK